MATKKKKAAKKPASKKKAAKRKTTVRKTVIKKKAIRKKPAAKNPVRLVLLPGGLRPLPRAFKKKGPASTSAAISGRISSQPIPRSILLEDPATFIHALVPVFNQVLNVHWEAYAGWNNMTGVPVGSFVVEMTVPQQPANTNGQLIYLFPGLASENLLLQPILQWGISHMGGDDFWTAGSCLVGSASDENLSELVQVTPGTKLTARMDLRRTSNGKFSYDCSFDNIPATRVQGVINEELKYCYITLESYNINFRSDYPASNRSVIRTISMRDLNNVNLVPAWQTKPNPGHHMEFALLGNQPGDIELHYS